MSRITAAALALIGLPTRRGEKGGALDGAGRAVSGLPFAVVISVVDQALISAANLIAGVLVMHSAAKEQYGLYGVGLAGILFIVGLTNGLIQSQLTVNAFRRPEAEVGQYVAAMLLSQIGVFFALLLLALGALAAGVISGLVAPSNAVLAAVTATVGFLVGIHEFFRSHCYLRRRPAEALALDGVLVAVWLLATFVAMRQQLVDRHVGAIIAYGVAALVASLYAAARARLPMRSGVAAAAGALSESWQNGRWALGGVFVTFVQNQSYIYLLGTLAGAAAIAEANGARMLLAPLALLSTGTSRTLMPRFARMQAEGDRERLLRLANLVQFALVAMVIAYCGLAAVGLRALRGVLLPESYTNTGPLLIAWAAVFVFQVVRGNLSLILQAGQDFRYITGANVFSAIGVVAIGIPLVLWLGAFGSLLSVAAGEGILALLLWRRVHSRK